MAANTKRSILCRYLSDKTSPVAVMLVGLLISVVPFALLGPSPFIEPLFRELHIFGQWHVWVGLVLLGTGCAMGLMPVLPAVLSASDRVRILMGIGIQALHDFGSKRHHLLVEQKRDFISVDWGLQSAFFKPAFIMGAELLCHQCSVMH